METEQRYHDEAGIPEYCTNTYNLSPSQKNMVLNPVDLLVLNKYSYMVEYRKNFPNWCEEGEEEEDEDEDEEEEEKALVSRQSVKSIPIKQEEEEEDNWFETRIQDMFPELANIYIHDALHGVETILPEPQEELHDIENKLTEPSEELHQNTVETILAESQIKKEKIAQVERETECKKLDQKIDEKLDFSLNNEIKIEDQIIETDVHNLNNQPTTSQRAYDTTQKNICIQKVHSHSKKRKTKTDKPKVTKNKEEQKENLDIDSNKTQGKGIEAVDLPSLLEKFEEIEKTIKSSKSNIHNSGKRKSGKKLQNRLIKQLTYIPKESAETTKIDESKLNNRNSGDHTDKHISPLNCVNNSSINLEHDYCIVYTDNSPGSSKHISKPSNNNSTQPGRCNSPREHKSSSKINDMSKKPTVPGSVKKQTQEINNSLTIKSALARNILKSRQKSSIIQTGPKQMVSVLKKPIQPSSDAKQYSPSNNINESNEIMTTTSSNDEIKNMAQNTETVPLQDIKQPVRKINIEEYRKKRKQTSNSNETNFSVQRKVVYIYHASTMTEPFEEEGKMVWSIREFDTVVKSVSKTNIETHKPEYHNASVQTYKTIFEFAGNSLTQNKKDDVAEGINKSSGRSRSNTASRSTSRSRSRSKTRRTNRSENRSMYKKKKVASNRNRSKSRNRDSSTSESRSRSRSRNSRSRSRSSSHRRYNTHSRRRRRSRDSSTSSCTSNARSRRRSRSSSYHSKSSSKYYSRRSRSPSTSNCRRSRRWSSDRERQYDRDRRYSRKEFHQDRDLRSRSPPQYYRRPYNDRNRREWQRQVEERRVVYVGGIEDGTTKADLRRRFETFGRIVDISLHFRAQSVSFGFVTFEYKNDAYRAVEHGNDGQPVKYQLSFGGRRAFCQVNYADLDGAVSGSYGNNSNSPTDQSSFDDLLQQALNRQKLV